MDQHWENNIEALSKWLGLLRITEENTSEEVIKTDSIDKMLTGLALVVQNEQAVMPKNMVSDLG